MSERDGWNHLYLYDGVTGAVKNQITKGDWVVRAVSARRSGEAPDLVQRRRHVSPARIRTSRHYYRINFDGTGLTRLTDRDANHTAAFSSDMKYLRRHLLARRPAARCRAAPHRRRCAVSPRSSTATSPSCVKAGWKAPEVFVAKGRDGKTDIWGVIIRPTQLRPGEEVSGDREHLRRTAGLVRARSRSSAYNQMQSQAELGFIVVQIDGMGTSNRSKAFHDVAWKNLGDAGFPDRILWHKARRREIPVLRHHPRRHLRRIGRRTERARRPALPSRVLQGRRRLRRLPRQPHGQDLVERAVDGMADRRRSTPPRRTSTTRTGCRATCCSSSASWTRTSIPSSTMQVVNQLIKHDKNFDLLVVPGANHPAGRGNDPTAPYGDHKRFDFFVQHLLGVTPPAWNRSDHDDVQ